MARIRKQGTQRPSALDRAVSYIDRRARTEFEVRTKLAQEDYCEEEIDYAIERLFEALLLNDEQYAENYVHSRLAVRTHSKRKLREELLKHHVDINIVDRVLDTVDDAEEQRNADEEAAKIMRSFFGKMDEMDCKNKTMRRLMQHGYGYETAKRATGNAWEGRTEAGED